MEYKICKICKSKFFNKEPGHKKAWGNRKYCSTSCSAHAAKGYKKELPVGSWKRIRQFTDWRGPNEIIHSEYGDILYVTWCKKEIERMLRDGWEYIIKLQRIKNIDGPVMAIFVRERVV